MNNENSGKQKILDTAPSPKEYSKTPKRPGNNRLLSECFNKIHPVALEILCQQTSSQMNTHCYGCPVFMKADYNKCNLIEWILYDLEEAARPQVVLPSVLCRFETEVKLVLRRLTRQGVLHHHSALRCLWSLRNYYTIKTNNFTQIISVDVLISSKLY